MSLPRISGSLYNCALNCALPHIRSNIQLIAHGLYLGSRQDAYDLLKLKFEQWYGVTLTWKDFNRLLTSLTFNEIELVLAPVLRLFVAEKCEEGEIENIRDIIEYEGQGVDPDVRALLESEPLDIPLNTPGKYLPLDANTANRLFYQHFGLDMRVHEFIESTHDDYQPIGAANPALVPINVYLKNGHFELKKHREVVEHFYQDERISEISERISSHVSAYETNCALADLIPLISTIISSNTPDHHLITPIEYIENVKKFKLHHDSTEGKLTYAVVLLTLMVNFPETKSFAHAKLKHSYALEAPEEIETLLADTIKEANNPGINRIYSPQTKSITSAQFNAILGQYHTSYWFLNGLIQLLSFGFYKHESQTIKELRSLSKASLITEDMLFIALNKDTGDSQQTRRLSFWKDNDMLQFDQNSATDNILVKLKRALK
jgi:hypothetical protein